MNPFSAAYCKASQVNYVTSELTAACISIFGFFFFLNMNMKYAHSTECENNTGDKTNKKKSKPTTLNPLMGGVSKILKSLVNNGLI